MMPMLEMSPQKQLYSRQDQLDWQRHWNGLNSQANRPEKPIALQWPDVFPIRSPTLLRLSIVDPNLIPVLYRACWEQNIDVSNPEVLAKHLSKIGFNSAELLKKASSQHIKDQVRANTDAALKLGLCGVPSYVVKELTGVNDKGEKEWTVNGGLVWGQDELGVVQDLVAGWREEGSKIVADVSATHQLGSIKLGPALKTKKELEALGKSVL
jgi:DSBA-like thioredoxin domain